MAIQSKAGGGVTQGLGQSLGQNVDPDISQPHAEGFDFNPQLAGGGGSGVNLGDIAAAGQQVNPTATNTGTQTGTGGSAGSGEVQVEGSGNIGPTSL